MLHRARSSRAKLALLASLAVIVAPLATSGVAYASGNGILPLPEAGYLSQLVVAAHAAPAAQSPVVQVLKEFRPDDRPTIVLAVARQGSWLKLLLPGRPNGRSGWVKAQALDGLEPRARLIRIDRGRRTLTVLERGHVLFRAAVAVGQPGMETPRGHFYVAASFHPAESVLGPWAFETSAYSKLSDWPGGGIVGIHGWSDPTVVGHAVSHGCVRLTDRDVLKLKRFVTLGTPVEIVD